jgi:hypothetical protein
VLGSVRTIMEIWTIFWTVALLVAGSGFALITLAVIVKGGGDLKAMLKGLKAHHEDDRTH